MTFNLKAIGMMTQIIMGLFVTLGINDTQHKSIKFRSAECHCAECHYAECRYAECHGFIATLIIIDTFC